MRSAFDLPTSHDGGEAFPKPRLLSPANQTSDGVIRAFHALQLREHIGCSLAFHRVLEHGDEHLQIGGASIGPLLLGEFIEPRVELGLVERFEPVNAARNGNDSQRKAQSEPRWQLSGWLEMLRRGGGGDVDGSRQRSRCSLVCQAKGGRSWRAGSWHRAGGSAG